MSFWVDFGLFTSLIWIVCTPFKLFVDANLAFHSTAL